MSSILAIRQNFKTRTIQKVSLNKNLMTASRNWELYLFFLPTLLFFIIFHYIPMYGVQLAFKDFMPKLGITGSPWIGLRHFTRFINSYYFKELIVNTLKLSIGSIVFGFPAPIILAIMLNQVKSKKLRRTFQTIVYAPHFISIVVLVGMIFVFLSPRIGMISHLIQFVTGQENVLMADPTMFRPIYIISNIWQNMGWGSIIYLASLSSIDPGLYEAASIDGASRFRKIIHIDIPSLLPTITILLILRMGQIMSVGFEKAYLMQTSPNLASSEIISTYVYKVGLEMGEFSFSTAVGLFNTVINFILLLTVNKIAKKTSEVSLW